MKTPAKFRQTGFLDLLSDAAFQLRLARAGESPYVVNRHARASIIASIFSVESCANCLLDDLGLSAPVLQDLEKFQPLTKYEFYALASKQEIKFDRGRAEVGQVKELISIRNGFVHPKASEMEAEMGDWREGETTDEWDIHFQATVHSSTAIPKQPLLWNLDHAAAALRSILGFFRYVFNEILKADHSEVRRVLCNRTEVLLGSTTFSIESSFEEFSSEFSLAAAEGFDFSFLGHEKNEPN